MSIVLLLSHSMHTHECTLIHSHTSYAHIYACIYIYIYALLNETI